LGILRVSKKYGGERGEIACGGAMSVGARSYRHVESILKHGLDRIASAEVAAPARPARFIHRMSPLALSGTTRVDA